MLTSLCHQLPRSYFAQDPHSGQWLQVIAKPDVAPLNWDEWSVSSEKAAYEKLQRDLGATYHPPGSRASVSSAVDSL